MDILIDIIRNLGPFLTMPSTSVDIQQAAGDTVKKCLMLMNRQLDQIDRQTNDIKVVKTFG